MHGWGITERIEQWSESVLQLGQVRVYPGSDRLERQELIHWSERHREQSPRALLLADAARDDVTSPMKPAQWHRMSRAVNLVLEATMNSGGA